MRKIRTLLGVTLAGACALAAVPGVATAAAPVATSSQAVADLADVTGAYYPVAPARLMDTRIGLGAPKAKIGPAAKVDLQVAGRGGVPTIGVGAVVLNVTITGPTAGSFVTVYPAGVTRPTASSVNFAAGWLGSNNVTVKLGSGGMASVYNNSGSTDVIVDVVGWYAKDNTPTNRAGGQYEWFEPQRVDDTRDDPAGKPLAGEALDYALSFQDTPERNTHVKAFVLNITAVSPSAGGFLTAWSGATARPNVSTVNYGAGKNVPNLAYVETTPCTGTEDSNFCVVGEPKFKIFTSQSAHILVDVVGVVDDGYGDLGMRFSPLSPTRIVDSRINQGITGAIGANATRTVTVPPALVTPDTGVLAMNVTAVQPTLNTVITTWPADPGVARPATSNLNPYAGQVVSNGVLGIIEPSAAFNVWNLQGSTHLVADVVGTFYYPAPVAATARQSLAGGATRPTLHVSSSR
ncbi:hypothetical protein V6U81_11340 [Micromonospora sp. CPCC 205711]|uniref:hypothetical protein n=1 Tax=Micromonospora sp. CPCC 205547 TaxID=3122400 RepID=UPI002FF3A03F